MKTRSIEEFIKTSLWPLIDSHIAWKYYGGTKQDLEDIVEKQKDLGRLIRSGDEGPGIDQALFIIKNILRDYIS